VGAFHRREDAKRLVVATQGKILEMNKTLCAVDLLGDTREDSKVIWKEFDGISTEGGKTAEIGIELDKWFVARRNRRFQQKIKLASATALTIVPLMEHCMARRRFESLGLPMRKKKMSPKRGRTYVSKSQAVADDGLRLRGTMKRSTTPTIQKITTAIRALTSHVHPQIILYLLITPSYSTTSLLE